MMRIECNKPEAVPESHRYDVFVSSRGVRYEFGPRRMKVVGIPTPGDNVEFVNHIRFRTAVRNGQAKPVTPVEKPQVRVLGIRMG
jgi:hypothetical protein